MKRYFTLLVILIPLLAHTQAKKAIFLKWKIQPGDTLSYLTEMTEMDTADFKGLSIKTGSKEDTAFQKIFKAMNKSYQDGELITNLTKNKKGFIDIEMSIKPKAPSPESLKDSISKKMNEFSELMRAMSGGVALRGAINVDGSIQSFYVKNNQKNLLACFFQLPAKSIKIGDSWPLDVNLVSMDQNFNCDTSFRKNNVTLIDIKYTGVDTIAVISYDIQEFVSGDFKVSFPTPFTAGEKTVMQMTYTAIAEFSLVKGRWITYNGIMAGSSTGFMDSKSRKKFSLVISRDK